MSSSEVSAPASSKALVLSSLVPSSSALLMPSSSAVPALASSRALVSATPLLLPSGGNVFAAVVPPARPSLCFTKKKIVG